MNTMKHKFQSEGRWEVVEILAKMWAAILYRRISVEKSNSREEERKIYVHSEGDGGEGRNLLLTISSPLFFFLNCISA